MKRTILDRVPEITAIAAERGFAEGILAAKTACVTCSHAALERLSEAAKAHHPELVAICDEATEKLAKAWSLSAPACDLHAAVIHAAVIRDEITARPLC